MQHIDGRIVLSASDLNDFLACEYLTGVELAVLRGELERPGEKAKQAEILARLGDEHERRYLERLRADGLGVVTIERPPVENGSRLERLHAQRDATIAAMRAGAEIIYQATFFDGSWLGHADVLRRIEEPSALGAWSYEVEDTKLARSLKPYFLVQLAFYSAFVERIQSRAPLYAYVVLGNGERKRFRVSEFAPYERFIKRLLEERVARGDDAAYPRPNSHCRICVWDATCSARRRKDDSLFLVAGLTRVQDRRLTAAGVTTLAKLAAANPTEPPKDVRGDTYEKLTRQARLQFEQRQALAAGAADPYRYELLPPQTTGPRGFALLPAPSPGDVFFDMEGDPYYDVAAGLEYLFGTFTRDRGFKAFWGCDRGEGPWHDRLAEKRAFESFVDFVMERRAEDPHMHVYHYATYEKRTLQFLAQQHATREDEVDTLLREERLVDLYRVVRQSVAVGQPGYGLKKLEAFFGGRSAAQIATGDESIVQFERWLDLRDGGEVQYHAGRDEILTEIERYNEQDCRSTAALLEWLLERRREAERVFEATIPFYTEGTTNDEPPKERNDKHAELKAQLRARIPEEFDPADPQAVRSPLWPLWLGQQLLEYHWREEKPEWWAFYDRCDRYVDNPEDLREDDTTIVDLALVGEPRKDGKSLAYTFTFPAQEYKIDKGTARDPLTKQKTGELFSIETHDGVGTLVLRRGPKVQTLPLPEAIIIHDTFRSDSLQAALARFVETLLTAESRSRYRAAYDLLVAGPPRFSKLPPGSDIQPEQPDSAAIGTLIDDLDESYLFVQGPPGSGKTYQGAHAVVSLLARGLRVGVSAHSHKAINNLLTEVERVARQRNVRFEGQRKSKNGDDAYRSPFEASSIVNTEKFLLGDGGLYAGTVWAFAGPDMDRQIDVLFVDEAGQVALPNALAAATSARRVVLLGDPLQLPHVHHTSHPGGIGVSVLEHLLGEEMRPVARDRGVLLDRTWRMHPDVCSFISSLMYENRLHPVPECARQSVASSGISGTGIRWIAVEHDGSRVRSEDEARIIANEIELLLKGSVTEANGRTRKLMPNDVIVVTPYNAQRRCIEAELRTRGGGCERVAVGTVDKFQGQEAFVVFFSSANSDPQNAVRGVEFIFDRNRLNVAISRARALAVYVGSPALLRATASSIDRMRALAAGCALVEAGSR